MTTLELLREAAEDTNFTGDGMHPRVRQRLLGYLNQGLQRVLAMPGMVKLIESDPPFVLASVADQPRCVVPESVGPIKQIVDRENEWPLRFLSLEDYRQLAPNPSTVTGTPTHYVPIGRVALATLPSDASELFIKSTASETPQATVRGVITDGYERTASVTMAGTTAVSLHTGITSWIDVRNLQISVPAVGTITLHEDSGAGTELARITIGQTRPRYYGVYLYPTPDAVRSYYVDSRRRTTTLRADEDEPPWPEEFHWVLSTYARMRQYEKGNDARFQVAKDDWESGTKALRNQVCFPPGTSVVAGPIEDPGSNLGSWYPRGRW